jgi:hypothetical protein
MVIIVPPVAGPTFGSMLVTTGLLTTVKTALTETSPPFEVKPILAE